MSHRDAIADAARAATEADACVDNAQARVSPAVELDAMHNWPQLAATCSLRRYLRRCLVGRLLPVSAAGFRQPLLNLTPQKRVGFRIPEMDVSVTFFLKKSGHETVQAVIDTLLIDTDALQVQLTWRVSHPHDATCITMQPEMYTVPVGCLSPADQ
ncbi:DUF2169 domain-containing protein [Xanthomonas sp. WHRI 7945]|nr:DUF2169 domain-containing protein [Xanthomonas campestris pv. campestris]